MATSGVKKVQRKIFGTGVMEATTVDSQVNESARCAIPDEADDDDGKCGSANLNQGPGLTLIIPKPKMPGPAPPNLPKKPTSDQSPKIDDVNGGDDAEEGEEVAENVPFRQRLAERLGKEYKGAERYRLSDRQWVGFSFWLGFVYGLKGGLIFYRRLLEKTIRWGEDGIAGISDNHQRLCLALSLWNGVDPILKERLFGVTGHQGNHGEDVKELYYYLDSTPTHSYMKFLYKYPQGKFPYEELVQENQRRDRTVSEYEILDTDVFDEDRYWDVFVEYAKDEQKPDNIYVRITTYNRGPDPATLHIIPQLWFPNTWSWPLEKPPMPSLAGSISGKDNINTITARHPTLGKTHLYCLSSPPPVDPTNNFDEDSGTDFVDPELLFTENDTNFSRLYGGTNPSLYVKDAFHDHIIPSHRPPIHEDSRESIFTRKIRTRTASFYGQEQDSSGPEHGPCTPFPPTEHYVNPEKKGTKAAAHYIFENIPGHGGCAVVRLKLTPERVERDPSLEDEALFDDAIEERRQEADEFYGALVFGPISDDLKQVMRQALGGMLWTKQFYRFIQKEWLAGDPAQPAPPPERKWVRNKDWPHLHIEDVLSMPDKWEYPFFAAWDTAFHCIPLAVVDPSFAKKQLDLLTREWYMKPDGQIPAYEWNFSDVNPPVHAWATFRVFKIERKLHGREDVPFLERVFQKLLLNFTWWVNRKDQGGNNVFEGGFLGLDNIGVFNRSEALPTGGTLRQADGTAWMAFYCLNMLNMALELAKRNTVYEDIASKFFEHFIFIADAMTYKEGEHEFTLWNEQDGMYYDAIDFGNGYSMQLPVRSLVGLIPLYATLVLEPAVINKFPGFKKRMEWFIDNRTEMANRNMANMKVAGKEQRRLLALASEDRLIKILEKMLDEDEFLSEHGIRSLSKKHKAQPWGMDVHGQRHEVPYWPGDSLSGMFGGNSNWRGPIWLATNFILIESLQRFYQYYGNDLQVECPTGSGYYMNLSSVAEEIQHRIIHLFGRDVEGRRATNGGSTKLDYDPHFRDYVWFHEFFHADSGKGLGASHQTGWSGLVAYHILQSGVNCRLPRTPKTPRSVVHHYFDETIDPHSAADDEPKSAFSGVELNTLGDISPDAL